MLGAVVSFDRCRRQGADIDRDGGGSKRSLFAVAFVFALFRFVAFARIPPSVMADRYLLQAKSAMEQQDYARARVAMGKVLELRSQHGIQVSAELYFDYAAASYGSGSLEIALEYARRYLEQAGCQDKRYMLASRLIDHLEREIGGPRPVEHERAARVAAVRQEAAKELPDEIRAMEFVRIPAGTIRMDSNGQEADSDEQPMGNLRISQAFDLGKYEVTQLEWTAVMGHDPSRTACGCCPVADVSWNEVQEFIGILNQAAGDGTRYRLPTNAEWVYAFRGGWEARHREGLFDSIAWHLGNSGLELHPVGQKAPNAFGLHDMLGNAWEWVEIPDTFQDPKGSVTDPTGPSRDSSGIVRGCSFISCFSRCVSESDPRFLGGRSDLGSDIEVGFRLARTAH